MKTSDNKGSQDSDIFVPDEKQKDQAHYTVVLVITITCYIS